MKKRRMAAFGLSMLLAMSVCGCAAGEKNGEVKLNPKKPVTISIWHYYNGAQKVAFDEMVEEFNDTVGMERGIIAEGHNQGDVNQLETNILSAVRKEVGSQEIPDIFASYADMAFTVERMGLLVDLDAYFSKEELAEYIPSYIEEGRIGLKGELKIFPIAKSTEVFMLNKTDWDSFAAATGTGLETLGTKEGLVRTAQAYYEYTDSLTPDIPGDGRAFYGRDAVANLFLIGAKQLGCDLFAVENQELRLNLDKEVIRRIWDVYYVPMVRGYFASFGRFRSDDTKVGKLIALTGSTSSASYFPTEVTVGDDTSYPIESLVLPAPVFDGGQPYAVQQGAGMAVFKSVPQKEYASAVFLKWFTDSRRNLDFSCASGYLPVKTEACDRSLLDDVLTHTQTDCPENVKKALRVGFDTVSSQPLYTSKTFDHGSEARKVLETSLSGLVAKDLEKIDLMVQQGTDRQKAASRFDTDAHFEEWYGSFKQQMEQAVG